MKPITDEQKKRAAEIAQRIDILTKTLGMPKGEFYQKANITSANFSYWRNGLNYPSPKKLANAAKCLGVSVAYLEYGDDSAQKEKPTVKDDGLSEFTEKEASILKWFRSLPEEKRRAILIAQDAPKELLD